MKYSIKELWILIFWILTSCNTFTGQNKSFSFQDKINQIRIEYEIPGMAMCIFSSDTIYEFITSGSVKLGSDIVIDKDKLWHLGSNTKSFISFAAASLVENEQISWDTKFFDLFPEYKEISKPEYYDITLGLLLQHRAGLPSNTRSFPELILQFVEVDTVLQRNTLFNWALSQDKYFGGYQYSNIGFIMAASMLEKVSGKFWKDILEERIFIPLSINAYYGWPAKIDTNQTWGHLVHPESKVFMPHPPDDLYELGRVGFGPAGNLTLSLPDFVKFLQDNLKGWKGEESLLDNESYRMMHNGSEYGLGWGIVETINESYHNVSIHSGSAGTFFSKALLFKNEDFGIALCMNRFVDNNNEMIYPLVDEVLDAYIGRK